MAPKFRPALVLVCLLLVAAPSCTLREASRSPEPIGVEVLDTTAGELVDVVRLRPLPGADLSADEAQAWAAWDVAQSLPGEALTPLHMLLLRDGRFEAFDDRREGPSALLAELDALAVSLGSREAALVALFAGAEPVEYATRKQRRHGDAPSLPSVAQRLPRRFPPAVRAASRALTLAGAYALAWPLPVETRMSSGFGMRMHPLRREQVLHGGIDLPVPVGSTVHAAGAGIVRRAAELGWNGRMVLIDHGRGIRTWYLHNDQLLVKPGDRVQRGDAIALSGNTGLSTGPHVHFQVELDGHPVDPLSLRRPVLKAPATEVPSTDPALASGPQSHVALPQ